MDRISLPGPVFCSPPVPEIYPVTVRSADWAGTPVSKVPPPAPMSGGEALGVPELAAIEDKPASRSAEIVVLVDGHGAHLDQRAATIAVLSLQHQRTAITLHQLNGEVLAGGGIERLDQRRVDDSGLRSVIGRVVADANQDLVNPGKRGRAAVC
nr:hypothetical protein [Brucella endophytica]